MAETLVKKTVSRDARGNVTTEEVWESFTPITANTNAKSYSQQQADGVYQLTQTFIDEIPDPGGGPNVYPDVWSCEVSTSAEPIENHPIFSSVSAAEWDKVRKWKNGVDLDIWTPAQQGPTGAKYQALINKGTTTFLSPRIVIKHSFVSQEKPDLEKIGKVNFPSFASGMSPAGIDYIVTGATCTTEGNRYRITYEWLGSALGGWDKDLYYGA
jgi:hypothetical protein